MSRPRKQREPPTPISGGEPEHRRFSRTCTAASSSKPAFDWQLVLRAICGGKSHGEGTGCQCSSGNGKEQRKAYAPPISWRPPGEKSVPSAL
eukprot:CAMPEP_0170495070 /NCGR_PEP_ID=MMETSP0208-20121228/15001_1 /TAXON_ID=197538 /ORGANISM="Strombidium inclinatum, Strain S3" /LENGTH=91 /DNA_ID=CAMNT_0010771209 /DNA_START=84 /DNA_END=359 /DNA_ORIENTATION=+